jgi:hypothetical protein
MGLGVKTMSGAGKKRVEKVKPGGPRLCTAIYRAAAATKYNHKNGLLNGLAS